MYGGNYGGSGFIGGGMGGGMGFNRFGNNGMNYQGMNGFHQIDYSGGWNPNVHDQMLQNNINRVFMQYDMNMSGQLEGQ